MVVIVSLVDVFGQGQRTTESVLQIVGDRGPRSTVDTLGVPIERLVESPAAGMALVIGVVGVLWSTGYVGAFGGR